MTAPLRSSMSGMGAYSHDRRDETMTPPVGTFRPHKNMLLIKPSLGSVRGTCYDLPSVQQFQHEYGLRQVRDGVTTADVVGGWSHHEPNPNVQPGRDFKMLNKHNRVPIVGCPAFLFQIMQERIIMPHIIIITNGRKILSQLLFTS